MDFLQVEAVHKMELNKWVLSDIQLTQHRFQHLAIAGETGSGKSSLLKIIGGIVTPDKGSVFFEQVKLKRVPDEKLLPGHPGIAYLSQYFELRNNYTVAEILSYANSLPVKEASLIYEVCQVDHLLTRRTDQISGGEKQRIALARLLVSAPRLLLLDEPFSNLDTMHKLVLKKVIHDIGQTLQITCMLVSHDPQDTLSWADEIIVLKAGRIVQKNTPQKIYQQPMDAYTAGLFGKYNVCDAAMVAHFMQCSIPLDRSKKLFIRPEDITIEKVEAAARTATIKTKTYYGSYYELTVELAGQFILVRVAACSLQPGDTVALRYNKTDAWYLSH
jgi:ABC-type sulfate/molybdate transport systems ATPase subunit